MKASKQDAEKYLKAKEVEQVSEMTKQFFHEYFDKYDGVDDKELFAALNQKFKMRVAYLNTQLRTMRLDPLHFEKSIDVMKSDTAKLPSIGFALSMAEEKLNAILSFVLSKESTPEKILAGITEVFYPKPPVEEPAKLEAVKD